MSKKPVDAEWTVPPPRSTQEIEAIELERLLRVCKPTGPAQIVRRPRPR